MREDRRKHYDDGFRREALELIKAGAGGNTLARRLAIPVYTARDWIRLYRSGVFCFNVCSTGSAVFFRSVG